MKYRYAYAGLIIIVLLFSVLSGCITPPKETPVSTIIDERSSQYQTPADTPSVVIQPTPQTGSYLTPATPFPTRTTIPPSYSYPLTQPTPDPRDRVCRIYTVNFDTTTEIKKIAEQFNLKNPPMYINYSITDVAYVSGTRGVIKKYSDQSESGSYKYVDPIAYLEITVRNRTTGTIYTQDGFGKGYEQYMKKTIKVWKPDDMLIEIGGYKLAGVITIWVKPVGNFENDTVSPGTECMYPQSFGANTVPAVTVPTTTATQAPSKSW